MNSFLFQINEFFIWLRIEALKITQSSIAANHKSPPSLASAPDPASDQMSLRCGHLNLDEAFTSFLFQRLFPIPHSWLTSCLSPIQSPYRPRPGRHPLFLLKMRTPKSALAVIQVIYCLSWYNFKYLLVHLFLLPWIQLHQPPPRQPTNGLSWRNLLQH